MTAVRMAILCSGERPGLLRLSGFRIGLFASLLAAWHGAPPQLAGQESPTRNVIVTDSNGKVRSGTLTDLASGQLTLGVFDQIRLQTKNLVSLKIKDRTCSIAPSDPLAILAGGDVFVLRPESIDDESLTGQWVRFPAWPPVKLPLESVRAALIHRPAGRSADAQLLNQALEYTEPQDAIVLTNGDTLAGELAGLSGQRMELAAPSGKSAVDLAAVRAVIFNPSLTNSEPWKGEGALICLVDGSRFRVRDLKFGALDRLTMRTAFGRELDLPLAAVESVRFLGGCAVYLSDLSPEDYRFQPFLDLKWPLRSDQNVCGGRLTLRGIEYAKGLGVHSKSTVTYRLDGKFRHFQATIGVDDDAQGKGSVVFEILLDGKPAYKSGVLTGSSPAVAIERLNVSGAKQLTLRVDYATLGDIEDHADWCDAVLLK